MKADYILIAVPGFFSLMALELFWARRRRPEAYSAPDSLANLACGIGSQLTGLLFILLIQPAYEWLYARAALFDLSARPVLAWTVAFFGVDFFYYWFHRASHRISFFWASHAVHHQSEWYNLSVALRQPWFGGLFSWVFYLPLAVVGVPYALYAVHGAINLLYQYWIHTESIGRMGPLEWVLNTPSHHRVHHGSNLRYLDKNYAGTLIIWDRLFGTFEPERETPTFGVVHPLATWSPLSANVDPWIGLARRSLALRGWDRLRVWLREPGWGEAFPAEPHPSRLRTATSRATAYAAWQFAMAFVLALAILYLPDRVGPGVRWLAGLGIFAIYVGLGAVLDGKRWAADFELARVGATIPLAIALFARAPWLMAAVIVQGALSLLFLWFQWKKEERGYDVEKGSGLGNGNGFDFSGGGAGAG